MVKILEEDTNKENLMQKYKMIVEVCKNTRGYFRNTIFDPIKLLAVE